MSTGVRDPFVHRFGRTERFAHWWVVSTVSLALLSGLRVGGDEGGGRPFPTLHVSAVVLLVLGLLTAVTLGDRRALLRAARTLFVLDQQDRAWLLARARRPWASRAHQHWGMFNPEQKAAAWGLALSVAGVITTGIQAWRGGFGGGLHAALVVTTLVLLGAHVFMAVVNPTTRPALAGMVLGRVPRTWAEAHHGRWVEEVDRERESAGTQR